MKKAMKYQNFEVSKKLIFFSKAQMFLIFVDFFIEKKSKKNRKYLVPKKIDQHCPNHYDQNRSEERRGGKECRSRWMAYH